MASEQCNVFLETPYMGLHAFSFRLKLAKRTGCGVHAFNPRTHEAKAGGLLWVYMEGYRPARGTQ